MSAPHNATGLTPHNLSAKLAAVRERRRLSRKRRYRRSKLDRYRADLVALHRMGVSYRDMAVYLRLEHRKQADPTTIRRYLIKLPEVINPEMEADHAGIPDAR